jgi:hypothetical protein
MEKSCIKWFIVKSAMDKPQVIFAVNLLMKTSQSAGGIVMNQPAG